MKHGISCEKQPHTALMKLVDHSLHDEEDDRPFLVDGVTWCGRCHSRVQLDYEELELPMRKKFESSKEGAK